MRYEYELNQQFARTDYGLILDNEVRFGTFKPDFLANEEWVEMLGPDANNRAHMMRAYQLTRWAIAQEDLSNLDKYRMRLAAMTHDWGEAIVGDTPDPLKTAEGEELERKAWLEVADSMLGENKSSQLATQVWPIIFPMQQNKLSRLWRGIEYMGYMETGLKAARAAGRVESYAEQFGLTPYQEEDLLAKLRDMGGKVCSASLVKLQNYKNYNSVRSFLGERDVHGSH